MARYKLLIVIKGRYIAGVGATILDARLCID